MVEVLTGHLFKPGMFVVLPHPLLQACSTTTCGSILAGYSPQALLISQGSLLVFSLIFIGPSLILALTLKYNKDKTYCRIKT